MVKHKISSFRTMRMHRRNLMRSLVCLTASLGMTVLTNAHATEAVEWTLNPEKSTIQWVATQNNAAVEGSFTDFTAEIVFHPDDLANSHATVTVDTASVTTGYSDAVTTLKDKDWFFIESFPKAVFKTGTITAVDDNNNFKSEGTLTIKDKTVPVTLNFLLHHMHEHEAHIIGEAILKRTDFNIGWSDTSQIEDKVTVKVEIKANR